MARFFVSLKVFFIGILLTICCSLFSAAGSFFGLNLKIYDLYLELPIKKSPGSHTLLIHNDITPNAVGTELELLIQQLTALKADKVVLLSQSIWPRQLLLRPNERVYSNFPRTEGQIVATYQLMAEQGVYRLFTSAHFTPQLNDYYPTIAKVQSSADYLNYFIDFHEFSNLTLTQALADNLISSLVTGKVVLVDLDYVQPHERFYTPLGDASYAQLQALAVETQLTQSRLIVLPEWISFFLLVLVFTLYFLILQLARPQGLVIFTVVMLALTLMGSVFMLAAGHLLLPIFELLLLQFGALVYLSVAFRLREELTVVNISSSLNARLSKKVQPPSFYQSRNPWDSLHTLINQQLNLHRSIFLAKVPKDHRVKAIHALNCSIDDIKEMRRDYQRTPYSEVIAQNKPLQLQRQYFTSLQENEIEFMCPLVVGNDVLGFWALTIVPTEEFNLTQFDNHLRLFSRELTELLVHRQNYQSSSRKENNLFRRFLGLRLMESEYRLLNQSVSMLERRYSTLQFVFDGMSTASALYNLFGQILHANNKMDQLVKKWRLPIYRLTAHDFLLQLTGLSSDDIKQRLLQVSLHKAQVSLRVNLAEHGDEYVLQIKAIDVADDKREQGLMVLGLLFEFIDISEALKVINMKKELYSQYFHQMRNNLSTLNLLSRQISKNIAEENKPLVAMLEQTLDECTRVNVVIEDQLAEQRKQQLSVVPLNPLATLKETLAVVAMDFEVKGGKIELKAPAIMSLTLAEPNQLERLYRHILDILVADCPAGAGWISIHLKDIETAEGERRIVIDFVNEGYGIPQEDIDKLMTAYRDTPQTLSEHAELLERLLNECHHANYWGLDVDIKSKLGDGFHITLTIPTFSIG